MTWAELDNESLGKAVKAGMSSLKKVSAEQDRLLSMSAAIILCNIAKEANADKLKINVEGLTIKGQLLGDWEVSIRAYNQAKC